MERENPVVESTVNEGVKRRTLAKGAIWSIPVVAVASAAPAFAASPQPTLSAAGRGTWNLTWYTERVDNYQSFKLFSTIPGNTSPGQGFCVLNSTTSSAISNASVTYYLPYYDLRFSAQNGPGFNGWSQLSRDSSKNNKYYRSVTYYAYTSVYSGGITAKNGTTCFPSFGFESNDGLNTSGYFFVDHSVLVNGSTLDANYGPVQMFG